MRTVHEISLITGVSVRALHHYDAIGLLSPTKVTDAGYRLYDDDALCRLQSILMFRELRFPLKEIKRIISSPNFDMSSALCDQIKLLELEKRRIENLISLARKITKTGGKVMDFSAFDKSNIDEYAARVKEKWGDTEAYREFGEKTKNQTPAEKKEHGMEIMNIFAEIGKIKDRAPDSKEAQELVGGLRDFITKNYYNCTLQIFGGLGQMYAAGGEFTDNIDKAGGKGTAEFSARAIEIYCKNAKA